MSIFAIADTHLSGNPPAKPMQMFGDHWLNHWDKIKYDWLKEVTENDTILLSGDISWALKLNEALIDLKEIIALPGKKIIIKGNHDYWWESVTKMNKAVDNQLFFLHNNFFPTEGYAICGSRGWLCPDDPYFTDEDLPTYNRELKRIEMSLNAALSAGYENIILMLHYPPVYDKIKGSGFTELMAKYKVQTCVYGHLHSDSIKTAPIGEIHGTTCYLVACDATDFKLMKIR